MGNDFKAKIAVFLDFDNIKLALEGKNLNFDINNLNEYLHSKGETVILKAYADWDKLVNISSEELKKEKDIKIEELNKLDKIKNKYEKNKKKAIIKENFRKAVDKLKQKKIREIRHIKRVLIENNYDIIDMPSKKSGKNFSDIQLVVDCMEASLMKSSVDTIAIISGDSDMTPLIKKLRSYGMKIIVVGIEHAMSKLLASVSDSFRFYKYLNLKAITPELMIESPYLAICKAVSLTSLLSNSDLLDLTFIKEKFNLLFSNKTHNNVVVSFNHILYQSRRQELLKYEEMDRDRIKITENLGKHLPPISYFCKYIDYLSIEGLKVYKKPYDILIENMDEISEELHKYFIKMIKDIIFFALFSEELIPIILETFLMIKPADSNYSRVKAAIEEALYTLESNKIIMYNEAENIYIPYNPDEYKIKVYYDREIKRLGLVLDNYYKENKRLKEEVNQLERVQDIRNELIDAIKLVEMKTNIDSAIRNLEEIITRTPYYKKTAKLYLGKAYMRKENYEKAIEIYEELLNSGLKYPGLLNVLGTAYLKIKDYEMALDRFEASLLLAVSQPKISQYVEALKKHFSNPISL
ncbi:MAG: NYN domain-containing protein [Spirochaetota bacterium]